jgi:hypothetical protein
MQIVTKVYLVEFTNVLGHWTLSDANSYMCPVGMGNVPNMTIESHQPRCVSYSVLNF